MCSACWQRRPDRPFVRVANLIAELDDPPDWLNDFAAHVAGPQCAPRASALISSVGRLLRDGGPTHPQALLERSRTTGRSMGTLAKVLQDFFTTRAMAMPVDHVTQLSARRRQRRVNAVPELLRGAVAGFADFMLQARERAQRAGTKPRTDSTMDSHLSTVRTLAIHLQSDRGKDDWATVDISDVESFLAVNPALRKTRLIPLRQFFRFARHRHIVLVDPTKGLIGRDPWGFRGKTVDLAGQRALFRRWTTDTSPHPHEALTGLLALLHGATSLELRCLTLDDIGQQNQTVQLGRRPRPIVLDPASWSALQRCLAHRETLKTANPHLIVTKVTKTAGMPASPAYLSHVLDPAGVAPKYLRNTRLVDLVNDMDPKLVAAAFGMDAESVLPYLADHVDPTRLPNP